MTEIIEINTDFIKLDSLLKLANIAGSGGMAKMMILDKLVTLNGEICTMRGKKIYNNDNVLVNIDGEKFDITVKKV